MLPTEVQGETGGPLAGRCPSCGDDRTADRIAGVDRNHGLPGRFEVLVCNRCGCGRTTPYVPGSELGALYPEDYAPYDLPTGGAEAAVSAAIRGWQSWRGLRRPPLRAIAGMSPGRILDVGCGRGDLGEAFLRRGWRVTGIEPSPEACAVARRRGIDAREGTLATVELEDAAYDAISFQHSLEHVDDPLAALVAARRSLRPGGLVLISVPNFGGWQARRFRSRWYHLDLPRHRTHFTPRGLGAVLTRAEFEAPSIATATSSMGLVLSLQYALAGRALATSGSAHRLAVAAAGIGHPFARVPDRLRGGDILTAVARRPG